jgi:hypothetical protein
MARDGGEPGGGKLGTELGWVETLEKGVEKQLAKGIGTEWSEHYEFWQKVHGGELGFWWPWGEHRAN